MISIRKYIDVEVKLKKLIVVDDVEDLKEALIKAKDLFYERQNTKEYLDDRKITFSENELIKEFSDCSTRIINDIDNRIMTKEEIKEFIYKNYSEEYSQYIYDETIKKLEELEYNFGKISI